MVHLSIWCLGWDSWKTGLKLACWGNWASFSPWVLSTWSFHQGGPTSYIAVQSSQRRAFRKEESKAAGPLKCYSHTVSLPLLLTQVMGLRAWDYSKAWIPAGMVPWGLSLGLSFSLVCHLPEGQRLSFSSLWSQYLAWNLTLSGHSLSDGWMREQKWNWRIKKQARLRKVRASGKLGVGAKCLRINSWCDVKRRPHTLPSILYLS